MSVLIMSITMFPAPFILSLLPCSKSEWIRIQGRQTKNWERGETQSSKQNEGDCDGPFSMTMEFRLKTGLKEDRGNNLNLNEL